MLYAENHLKDVHETVRYNMTDLLKRGETLQSLMEKSKDLSKTSVKYYERAKRTNKQASGECCRIC